MKLPEFRFPNNLFRQLSGKNVWAIGHSTHDNPSLYVLDTLPMIIPPCMYLLDWKQSHCRLLLVTPAVYPKSQNQAENITFAFPSFIIKLRQIGPGVLELFSYKQTNRHPNIGNNFV